VRGSTLNHPKLGLPIVAVVLALVVSATGCGGGGDDEGSDTGTGGTQPQAGTETSPNGSGDSAAGSEGSSADRAQSGAGNPADGGSGGAGAPRTGDPVHRRSLARYLAARYARTPWYPLIRRIKVTGSEVRVYMNFPPESDDESPPLLACTAVLSYGRQVRDVFVYGSPTPQGQNVILKRC
jgi:hypothetical protein